MKGKKKAFLLSFLSLLMCVSMFIGTTFAWFTDSVTSGINKIIAGNLDIDVEYINDNTKGWTKLQDSDSVFSKGYWEPGHTEFATMKVTNKGSLALKYQMNVSPITEKGGINVKGESFKMSDYLVFGTTEPKESQTDYTRETAREAVGATMGLTPTNLTKNSTLEAGKVEYITLVVYMPETVGNEANYKTGTTAPEIELGIRFVATQLNSESDSFGPDYDTNATYPITILPEIKNASMTKTDTNAFIYTNSDNTVKATVPSGATLTSSEIAPTVSIKPTTVDNTASMEIKSDGKDAIAYDIKVSNLDENNTEKVTVELFVGKNLVGVTVYHNSEAMAAEDYSYDETTGYVTIRTANFSTFSVAFEPPVASVNGVAYYTLKSAIESAKAGDTVVLVKDVSVLDTIEINKSITLNLNGKTIENYVTLDRAFNVTSSVDFVIDGMVDGSSMVIPSNINSYGFVNVSSSATVTLNGGYYGGYTYRGDTDKGAFIQVVNRYSNADIRLNNIDVETNKRIVYTDTLDTISISVIDCNFKSTGEVANGDEMYAVFSIDTFDLDAPIIFKNVNLKTNGGACIESSGGTATYTDCDFTITNSSNPSFVATAVAVSWEGKANIISGNYISAGYGAYVYTSGGTINIKGGVIKGDTKAVCSGIGYDNVLSTVNISGGKIIGTLYAYGTNDRGNATISVTGGTFSSDPSEYCAEGYGAIETEGMFNVIAGTFAKTVEELASKVNTATTKVYVTNDLTFDRSVSIPAGITIDALNHKFTINNLNAFSGEGFTVENAVFEKGTTWGMATGSCSYENCTFNNVSPYICPSTDLPISVKNCTFKDTMLQICWSEGSEKDPTKQTTTITGNTFNYTATDSKNHVIALNAGSNINYSKVEVSNNTFNNDGEAAYSALYISDPVHSKGGISVNYFDNVENNASIGYRDSNGYYKKVVENNVVYAIYENGEKYLVKVTADYEGESFEIPDDVVAIGDWAFSSSTVKKVVVPASVTDLGRGFDTSVVEEVVLPEGLTTISSRAFRKTPNLKSLTIPSTVTTIVENAFQQAGIETIVIPESVTSIEFGAFRDCSKLTTVTIEGSPTIANYAFRACSSLTTVNLNGADVKFGEGIAMVFSTQENNNDNSKITVYVVNETVQARVDAIKGKGVPYNIVLREQTA